MTEVVISLTIRDLTPEDLSWCSWSGSVTGIARALDRAGRGLADYLMVCPPSGHPVALCAVDYAKSPSAGTLWQLAVHGALQSCGIGTLLIGAAEQRSAPAACTGPSWPWRSATRRPAHCTSGWATSPTAANPPRGTRRLLTDPSSVTKRPAR